MKNQRLYRSILKPHRGSATIVVGAALSAGILEALGLSALLPVLGRQDDSARAIYMGLVVLGGLLLASVSVRAFADVRMAGLNVAVEGRLRREFLEALIESRWSALRDTRSGDLVTALMSESSQVANGASAYLTSLAAACIAACLAVTAVVIAPVIAVVAGAFAMVSVIAYRRAGAMSRVNQAALAVTAADMNEEAVALLGNLKMLLSTGDRAAWCTRMESKLVELIGLRRRDLVIPTVSRASVEAAGAAFLVGAMALTVSLGGRPSAALVTLALFYRVVPRIQVAQSSLLVAKTQAVWWERWQHRKQTWYSASDKIACSTEIPFTRPLQVLELDSVEVTYPGRRTPALDGLSLKLGPGQILAVVGHTGSGKSTLLDVVTGLITPTHGRCSVNGTSLLDLDLDSWQRCIGLVPQEAPVVHGTVLENIVWLEAMTDRGCAREAISIAELDDMVAALPNGLDTIVGPRGASISGGQRQRLSIARALYRRPTLLILDEATSGLDPATEQRLLRSLIQHCVDTTIIIVTHRLDTVALVDEVVVLEEGRTVARGPFGPGTAAAIERIRAVETVGDPA